MYFDIVFLLQNCSKSDFSNIGLDINTFAIFSASTDFITGSLERIVTNLSFNALILFMSLIVSYDCTSIALRKYNINSSQFHLVVTSNNNL